VAGGQEKGAEGCRGVHLGHARADSAALTWASRVAVKLEVALSAKKSAASSREPISWYQPTL